MKKTIRTIAAAALAVALTGCSSGSAAGGNSGSAPAEDKHIAVGVNPVPHAEILENAVKQVLADEGWELEVVVFEDYVLPNTSLEEGELDANYFQTLGYMNDQNDNNGLHLAAVAGVHIEPMGIYSEKHASIDELADGATIGVPNDTDNYYRALDLLVAQGFLNGTDNETVLNGSKELNPHGYVITPIEAAGLPRSLSDLDFAVINGNYALEAGLPEKSPALLIETFDAESSVRRTNYLVVKQGNENSEKIQALVEAIVSPEVEKYIQDTYKGSVIPSFVDANGKPLN